MDPYEPDCWMAKVCENRVISIKLMKRPGSMTYILYNITCYDSPNLTLITVISGLVMHDVIGLINL
jgi:hypothetical protein